MQFAVSGTNQQGFAVYNVVGLRQSSGVDVSSLTAARPTAIPNNVDNQTLQYGLSAQTMRYIDGSGITRNIGAVAFMTSFLPSNGGGGGFTSGTPSVNVVPVDGSGLNQDQPTTVAAIAALNDSTPTNPSSGVIICFQSGGTDQYGQLTLGSNGRALTTKLVINQGTCP
jgi:hypothetical protein